jgi:hypothetical protein
MRQLIYAWAGLLALFLTLGCQAPTLAPATTPDIPVQVRLQVSGYQVQALVKAYALADVDHVVLKVYRNGAVVAGATRTIAASALQQPLSLSGLKMGTTYQVRAVAYKDAAETVSISDPIRSVAQFTTPALTTTRGVASIDATPLAVSLPIKLTDQVFSGKATLTVSVLKSKYRRAQVTLYRGTEVAYQEPSYEVTDQNELRVVLLKNLKPGVSNYRLTLDGMNVNDKVLGTAELSFSTVATAGVLNDQLGPFRLTVN